MENHIFIKKTGEYQIDVPTVENILNQGLYIMVYNGKVRKVGIFGEGVSSTNRTRFQSYKSMGKNLFEYISNPTKKQNGSFKTIKVLNEKLEIGEKVEVRFKELPKYKYMDGHRWKVDLYYEEEKLKQAYKNTLWLS